MARHALGLSAQAFADLCGISAGAINKFEQGISFPRLENLHKILKVLNDYGVVLVRSENHFSGVMVHISKMPDPHNISRLFPEHKLGDVPINISTQTLKDAEAAFDKAAEFFDSMQNPKG